MMGKVQPGNDAPVTSEQFASSDYVAHPELFSDEQVRSYEEKGYLIFDPGYTEAEIEQMRARYEEIRDQPETMPKGMVRVRSLVPGTEHLEKLERIHLDPVLGPLHSHGPKLLHYVHGIVGDAGLRTMSTKFLVKPSGAPEHPAHQDWLYFYFKPEHMRYVVGTWVALEDADMDNGTLYMIPGSHKKPLQEHKLSGQTGIQRVAYQTVDPGVMKEYIDAGKMVPLNVKRGQAVLFHPLVIHGAYENPSRSKRTRQVLTAHYVSNDCERLDSVIGSIHESIARDLYEIFKYKRKQSGIEMPQEPSDKNLRQTLLLDDVPNSAIKAKL